MPHLTKDPRLEQLHLKCFCAIAIVLLFIGAFIFASPAELLRGMAIIVISRDALITDYFALAGYGSAFLNGALTLTIVLVILIKFKVHFTGLTLAAFFINAGFAFFGKNPINIIPIFLGTYIYSLIHQVKITRYVYTALFGTCLAPLVIEMVHILPFGLVPNLFVAICVGFMIGYILPTLAAHTPSMHLGYNLFNVGFAAGILGFCIVSVLEAVGFASPSVMIWQEGRPLWLIVTLYSFFLIIFVYGFWICEWKFKPFIRILRHPGRAVADFVLMDGIGPTLMNMSVIGAFGLTYILIIGGDLSGPVVGGILTIFGFAAFGVHIRNFVPCLIGVFLSTFLQAFTPTMPSIQLAALFSAGLAPIAGQFGILAGIIAGILHTCIVTGTSDMYAGLNLYNNGFSAGFVAIIMVPLLENFKTYSYTRKK